MSSNTKKFKRIMNLKADEKLFRFESPTIIKRKLRDTDFKAKVENYIERKAGENRQASEQIFTEMIKEEETMALRVIRRFEGVSNLMKAFKAIGRPKVKSTIYKWTYPTDKGGTGGLIPTTALKDLRAAAFHAGVYLSDEDLSIIPTLKKDIRRAAVRTKEGKVIPFLNSIERSTLKNHEIAKSQRREALSRVIKRAKKSERKKIAKRFKKYDERVADLVKENTTLKVKINYLTKLLKRRKK